MLYNLVAKTLQYFQRKNSYAQDGEDIVFLSLIENRLCPKYYVDIGAHHPIRFSNTHLLYRRGWRGINIDATPGSMRAFKTLRPADINLEIGVGKEETEIDFYLFNEPALNTFKRDVADAANQGRYKITSTKKVPVKPLKTILNEYAPEKEIGLLTIDVEGLDLDVLKSNDWNRWRPKFIMVEDHDFDLSNPGKSDIYKYLRELNYSLRISLKRTKIYEDSVFLNPKPIEVVITIPTIIKYYL